MKGDMSSPIVASSAEPAARPAGKALRVILAGGAATAVVGWFLALPLLMGELLVRQLAGRVLDAPWTPFGADRDGKTQLGVLVVVVVVIPLILLALAIGRAVQRRLELRGRLAVIHWLGSLVLLLTPFLLGRADVIGFDTMLGNGWLW
jgi:hypothetical protein